MAKKHQFNYKEVEKLAASGLTFEEMAAVLGVSHDTLLRRRKDDPLFNQALLKGKATVKMEITNKLVEQAKSGNLTAIIWYEKTRLGYREKRDPEPEPEVDRNSALCLLLERLEKLSQQRQMDIKEGKPDPFLYAETGEAQPEDEEPVIEIKPPDPIEQEKRERAARLARELREIEEETNLNKAEDTVNRLRSRLRQDSRCKTLTVEAYNEIFAKLEKADKRQKQLYRENWERTRPIQPPPNFFIL
jgi:hypothetical protein